MLIRSLLACDCMAAAEFLTVYGDIPTTTHYLQLLR